LRAGLRLGPGDHFGERALQKAEPRDATVVSIPEPPATETRLFKLTKAQFESVLPPLVEIIDKTAAEREEQAARAARPEILFKELKLITVLGEGTFGRVRLVQYVNKGTPAKKEAFALKTLQKGQLVYYKQVGARAACACALHAVRRRHPPPAPADGPRLVRRLVAAVDRWSTW
jgi:CRP-like cAMP-binding protein